MPDIMVVYEDKGIFKLSIKFLGMIIATIFISNYSIIIIAIGKIII